jgi:type IV pilus assembly protein PilA
MKKNNNKGFTLIELLVVVAIIGILAAVGVVAYSGYTASAKKNAAKSNHATVLKYISAEVQKCSIGEDNVMKKPDGTFALACGNRTTAGAVATAATAALAEFKNSYGEVPSGGSKLAVFDSAALTACAQGVKGRTNISDTGSVFTVQTCIDENTAGLMKSTGTIE